MNGSMAEGADEDPGRLPLERIPGFLIRCAQQIHNALWSTHVPGDVTSPQYAVLATLASQPGLSQGRVGELASLDKSSVAEVVGRLVDRGWVARSCDPLDARRHRLRLAKEATVALRRLMPDAVGVQEHFLGPLPPRQRALFVERLRCIARFEHEPAGVRNAPTVPVLDLEVPGHLIRCAQQEHTAIWLRTFGREITGPQYAILHVLAHRPDFSQRALGEVTALDRSTVADLVDRLDRRGWLERDRDPADGRRKLVRLSDTATRSLARYAAGMITVQRELVAPLRLASRDPFITQLATVALVGAGRGGR
jgi:DNA-binding MarR family transcriptional regulator